MSPSEATPSPSVAGAAPPPPPDPECKTLSDKNKEFRKKNDDKVIKTVNDKDVTFGESGTVAHGNFTSASDGHGPYIGVSATKQLEAAKVGGLCKPTTDVHDAKEWTDKYDNQRSTPVSYKMKVCPENVCIHPAGGLEAHAELNIINNLPKPPTPGDKLLLSIDWNSDKGKGNPCPNTTRRSHAPASASRSPPATRMVSASTAAKTPRKWICEMPQDVTRLYDLSLCRPTWRRIRWSSLGRSRGAPCANRRDSAFEGP